MEREELNTLCFIPKLCSQSALSMGPKLLDHSTIEDEKCGHRKKGQAETRALCLMT